MKRRDFLKNTWTTAAGVTLSGGLLSGFSRCNYKSSSSARRSRSDVIPNDFTDVYNFDFQRFPMLQNSKNAIQIAVQATSGQKVVSVVRIDAVTASCVLMICSLQFSRLSPYNLILDGFSCPYHGCRFYADGSVMAGPATSALTTYPAVITASSIQVTIT